MSKRILIFAPHPDDEILGIGGTILREKRFGAQVGWAIVTKISEMTGWSEEKVNSRESEILSIKNAVKFDDVFEMGFPTTSLDDIPIKSLVKSFSDVINKFQPSDVYIPHYSDVHTDHQVVFDVACSVVKWFRYSCVTRVLAYETVSETDFGLKPNSTFSPNIFVDISDFMDAKLDLLDIYKSEISTPPFPRSKEVVRSLATLRGAASGFRYAEAFQLLRERVCLQ